MDADRFDSLARSLTDPASRRILLGTPLVGVLAALGLTAAEAKKGKKKNKNKKKKKNCGAGKTRCGKDCADTKTDVRHCGTCGNECEGDQRCLEGQCFTICSPACAETNVCCAAECTDLTTDARNCGQCGTVCAENEVCRFANCGCLGPRCPVPGGGTRCCPAANGTCCSNGRCCPAGETCEPDNFCCLAGRYSCGNGLCCPIGTICTAGGNCIL